ncbi:cysteine dioxygenase family protein [Pseudonocardia sp.]|uniref:cysteine dioxygenase n=1 Tax=Pseudonocardia sp. TaxID=60912 RepID=UPI00261FA896|nr:cysteine dioxygenase family protein [Pseudonocardia sp.]
MLQHAPRAVPISLGLTDLVALTRRVAMDVRAGAHPVVIDPERRWYQRIQGDDYVDVWLISWATEQHAEMHDHAGSLGALTVVSGTLAETRWTASGPASRRLRTGRSVGFGLGHVHDVANPSPTPAVSVHAYSPPLTAMSYYAPDPDGARLRLHRTRSVLVEAGTSEGIG